MIAKATYLAQANDLTDLANLFRERAKEHLVAIESFADLTLFGKKFMKRYTEEFQDHLLKTLDKVGKEAATYYNSVLNLGLPEDKLQKLIDKEIKSLYKDKYYGLNLQQRLTFRHQQAVTRVIKSSNVGAKLDTRKENVSRVFADKYPFGAQVDTDKRILLSESVRLEHQLAKKLGKEKETQEPVLVKWTLSDYHAQKDICDSLAEDVDKKVETYIKKNKLGIEPEGVYFIDDVPTPPHPNCQCTIEYIYGKKLHKERKKSTVNTIIKLIDRIFNRK